MTVTTPDRFGGAFHGRTAVVTGGGSGVGAAFTRALTAAGAEVLCADIDLAGAAQVVAGASGPGRATAVRLDVTDADAVEDAVAAFVADHGRLDLVFNNAGIVIAGETHLQSRADWDRIIDINLRGVVHGVLAAYPRMIEAGSGHIVNTASAAGLMPAGLMTSYAATKHAVVGLSLALRTEAKAHGVGVTVVCPSAVETPILDKGSLDGFDGRRFFLEAEKTSQAYDVDRLAHDVLRAVAKNRALVIVPAKTRMGWRIGRLSPALLRRMTTRFVAEQQAQISKNAQNAG